MPFPKPLVVCNCAIVVRGNEAINPLSRRIFPARRPSNKTKRNNNTHLYFICTVLIHSGVPHDHIRFYYARYEIFSRLKLLRRQQGNPIEMTNWRYHYSSHVDNPDSGFPYLRPNEIPAGLQFALPARFSP